MRCPKCGYISFDYNEVCPRCNKAITPEREKMKLPSYKPDPPSLLGALTGKPKKSSDVDLMEAPGTAELLDRELDFTTEDLDFKEEDVLTTETTEPELDDTYSFEVPFEEEAEGRGQESTETFEFSESAEDIEEVELSSIESDEDLSLDIEEIGIEESELEPSSEPSIEDGIVLESDDITTGDKDTEATSASELPSFDEETASLDLGDLIEAEPGITLEEQEAEVPIEIDDTISFDSEEQSLDEPGIVFEEQEEEVPIEIDETISLDSEEKPPGEPEIVFEEQEEEASFDLDKTISLNLEDLPKAESEISLEERPESGGGKVEELLSLEDLKDEEIDSIVSNSEVSTDELAIDQELDLALDEDTLSTEEIPISAEISEDDEDLSIDLDSLDLDLELEEPDDK